MRSSLNLGRLILTIVILLISGCQATETLVTERPTEFASTETPIPEPTDSPTETPTVTPTITANPDPLSFVEQISIPDCLPNQSLPEEGFFSGLFNMESYRYRTLYQYKDVDIYPVGELAMVIEGAHDGGRVNKFDVLTIEFPSWIYPRSHIVSQDLRTHEETELVITESGVWVKTDYQAGWIEFTIDEPNDLINVTEIFGPELILWMLSGIRLQEDTQVQESHIVLNGEDVIHYCWVEKDTQFLTHYFLDYRPLGTALNNTTMHIWVTELDRHLVRLALSGESPSDFYGEEIIHDTPFDFLLWLEVTDINREVIIEPPIPDNVKLTFPGGESEELPQPESTPDVIPIAEGAVEIDQDKLDKLISRDIPREFINIPEWTLKSVSEYGQSISFFFPDYKLPVYETQMGFFEIANFYTNVLEDQGWDLYHYVLQLGELKFILLFKKGGEIITLAITGSEGKAIFWFVTNES